MEPAGASEVFGSQLSPSMRGVGRAASPSGPALPDEPEEPASLLEAELWFETYDRYVAKVTELARDEKLEDELQPWIDRCARRRLYWARARDRLQRLEARQGTG